MSDAENNEQRKEVQDDVDRLLDDVNSIDRIAAGKPDMTDLEVKVDEVRQDIADRAEHIKQEATEKVEELKQMAQDQISQNAPEVQRRLRETADDAKKEVVKQLNVAAETIRREAREANAGDDLKRNADDVAKGLEKAASYLGNRSVDEMGEDATRVVKNNPWRSVSVIFLIGLVIGMILRGDNK